MAEAQSQPGSGSGTGGTFGDAKGIVQSLSHGIRQLLVLEEKLTSLSKEDERFRKYIEDLQTTVQRMVGTLKPVCEVTGRAVACDWDGRGGGASGGSRPR